MAMVFLRVVLGSGLGGIEEGEGFELVGEPPWELGRAPHQGPSLEDRSISRRHARLLNEQGDRWYVENISRHNGVFVDGEEIVPGERLEIGPEQFHLQLGSVVFEVRWLEETLPFRQVLRSPEQRRAGEVKEVGEQEGGALFTLSRDGDCCVVRCKGKLLALKPSCALAFYALCERAGEVVHGWDILDVMGGEFDLPQAISGVRRELREVMESGWLTRQEVIEGILQMRALEDDEELGDLDDGALIRRFILSRRGHGYALMLPGEKIALIDEG